MTWGSRTSQKYVKNKKNLEKQIQAKNQKIAVMSILQY